MTLLPSWPVSSVSWPSSRVQGLGVLVQVDGGVAVAQHGARVVHLVLGRGPVLVEGGEVDSVALEDLGVTLDGELTAPSELDQVSKSLNWTVFFLKRQDVLGED